MVGFSIKYTMRVVNRPLSKHKQVIYSLLHDLDFSAPANFVLRAQLQAA